MTEYKSCDCGISSEKQIKFPPIRNLKYNRESPLRLQFAVINAILYEIVRAYPRKDRI